MSEQAPPKKLKRETDAVPLPDKEIKEVKKIGKETKS